MPRKIYETQEPKQKGYLVSVAVNKEFNPEESLIELKALAEAGEIEVVGTLFQSTNQPSVQFLIGTGKLEELKAEVERTNPDLVIFDCELSGMRLRNLEEELKCKVIDRSMLILDIFATRALSSEGKLQVELAQLKYSMPRLLGLSASKNKYGSGVGMRGPGETKLELDKRRINDQLLRIENKLKELEKNRETTRMSRKKNQVKTVALVGYTNSGKSTLLNTLTKANVLSKDMLFATLDTTSRNIWFEPGKQAVITDTVGFVSRLPHDLINAFKSTLKETVDADLLVVVVDISSKRALRELEIVFDVLKDLKVSNKPIIIALNKIDKGIIKNDVKEKYSHVVEISAKNNLGLDILKENIIKMLF